MRLSLHARLQNALTHRGLMLPGTQQHLTLTLLIVVLCDSTQKPSASQHSKHPLAAADVSQSSM
jgi:hypothetical protein